MAMADAARGAVLLVGGSPEPSCAGLVRALAAEARAVVAIDRGLDVLTAADVRCDLFCGDADSVGEAGHALVARAEREDAATRPFEVERYNPHKDFTDLSLALRAVGERWGEVPLVCTCLGGGHPDHLLGVLGRLASWGAPVALSEDGFEGRILHPGESWTLASHMSERFSFVPLSPVAEVSETGMRWELDHAQVELLSDLGISNVVEADPACIACHAGTLACWVFSR